MFSRASKWLVLTQLHLMIDNSIKSLQDSRKKTPCPPRQSRRIWRNISLVTLSSLLGSNFSPRMTVFLCPTRGLNSSCKPSVRSPSDLKAYVTDACSLTLDLSASDVQFCSPKYWAMMTDPIMSLDTAMYTILAAHVGLTIGSLSRHLHKRPDLRPLVNSLLRFDTVGIYLLTERGHGLDAFNIETTATKTPDGFIINTPREEACKYVHFLVRMQLRDRFVFRFMPASTPSFGIPKVALVMARLMIDGEDRGPRFFIVPVCNEHEMHEGVESIRLGPRPGTSPLDFSITRFNHVHVPFTALVSSNLYDHSSPVSPLEAWWDEVWRIPLGTLAVTAPWISSIKAAAFIAGRYSMHRSLLGKGTDPVPIISFRTQQWPIAHATAVGLVMSNWFPMVTKQSADKSMDHHVRHGLAVIVKTTTCRHFQRCVPEVSERCGAQGTFECNYMARIEVRTHSVQ